MEEGAAFDVLLECPANVASALLVGCGCHDDWLLVDAFFWKISALCCGVWLILNVPAPSIDNGQVSL